MVNPFQADSFKKVKKIVKFYNFYTHIYEEYENQDKKQMQMPKVIFLPNPAIMKCMILANLKFAKKDSLQAFLLRFGVIEDEAWNFE